MITIDRGVYTSIQINVSEDIDFTLVKKLILTIKNHVKDKPILIFEIYESGEHTLEITPEQSLNINKNAVYDFDLITLDDKRYKITENENIIIREGVGNYYD